MTDRTKGNLALLLTAVLWGTGFISQKLGNEVMPPMTFNAVRQLMASAVLSPLVLRDLRRTSYLSVEANGSAAVRWRQKRLLAAGVLCGFFLLVGSATQQIGLLTVSAGKSGFISSVYIVFVPVFSVMLGRRVRLRSIACIALAMAGFAVMSLRGGLGGATAGDWLTLVSAAGFAAQIVAVDFFVDKDNALMISGLQFFWCGVFGLIVALIVEGPTLASVAAGIPLLLYQTFVPTAGGYTLQVVGQKYTDSSTAALIMSLEAVFAAVFGALFLREMMSARELAGAAVIMLATLLGQKE